MSLISPTREQTVGYLCNGILLSDKKDQPTDTDNMDESPKPTDWAKEVRQKSLIDLTPFIWSFRIGKTIVVEMKSDQ